MTLWWVQMTLLKVSWVSLGRDKTPLARINKLNRTLRSLWTGRVKTTYFKGVILGYQKRPFCFFTVYIYP